MKQKNEQKIIPTRKMGKITVGLCAILLLAGALCSLGAPANHYRDNLFSSHNILAAFNLAVNQLKTDDEGKDYLKSRFESANAWGRALFIKSKNQKPEYRAGRTLRFLSSVKLLF